MSDHLPSTPSARSHLPGKAALDAFYRGAPRVGKPLLFLDLDDVICLSSPYGGYDVFQPPEQRPADLWQRLWHPPAVEVLSTLLKEFQPTVVLTTSWLRLMEREGFVTLFNRTGLPEVAESLHEAWEAPQTRGGTRFQAIEKWLFARYEGQPMLVLDDPYSGSGLRESKLQRAGCLILCEVGVGLTASHLSLARRALQGSNRPR